VADAETPTHGLAERLDEDATYWRDLHAEQPIRPGYEWIARVPLRPSSASSTASRRRRETPVPSLTR